MKSFCFTIILLLFVRLLYAQFSIQGTIKDTNSAGVAFANVLLLNQKDSSLVKGSVTDDKGNYSLNNIENGNYIIESYMIGYAKKYTTKLDFNNKKNIDLKPIILSQTTRELKSVVVKADKPLYEIGRGKMVVNVASSITSSGQSVIDILEKSPGVIVNRQNSNLEIGGKNGVIVMINGRRSRMPMNALFQMLDGINAGNIEKIEIMTVPPANYDAEGNAGFINIIMKKGNNVGTNGSLMTHAGYGSGPRAGTSITLNHRGRKVNIHGNYSFNLTKRIRHFNMYRRTNGNTETVNSSTEQTGNVRDIAHNYQVGMDYYIGKKTIISALASGYTNIFTLKAKTNAFFDYSVSTDTLIKTITGERSLWQPFMGNLGIHQSFNKGQALDADIDYLRYFGSDPTHYNYQYFAPSDSIRKETESRISKDSPINIWIGKIDYSFKIGSSAALSSGLKTTWSDLINDIAYQDYIGGNWNDVARFSNYADLMEVVPAVYTSLKLKINNKTTINTGLRYEYTRTNLRSKNDSTLFTRSFGNYFPTLFLSRKINKNNTLQFSYGRRIDRPTYNELAPFVFFVNPYTYFTGNPDILPTFSNNMKIDFSHKGLIFSLQYSHDKNVILQYQFNIDPETNIMEIQTNNIDRRNTISFTMNAPFRVADWWEMQNNFTGNWQMIATQNEDGLYKRSQYGFQANSTQTFKLPDNFTVEVSGFYMSPVINGYYNWLARSFVNLGIQKAIGDKGTLRFSCNDIFQTSQLRFKSDDNGLYYFHGNYRPDGRVFSISYSQKFGNHKIRGLRKRKNGAEEELKRVTN